MHKTILEFIINELKEYTKYIHVSRIYESNDTYFDVTYIGWNADIVVNFKNFKIVIDDNTIRLIYYSVEIMSTQIAAPGSIESIIEAVKNFAFGNIKNIK